VRRPLPEVDWEAAPAARNVLSFREEIERSLIPRIDPYILALLATVAMASLLPGRGVVATCLLRDAWRLSRFRPWRRRMGWITMGFATSVAHRSRRRPTSAPDQPAHHPFITLE
jgi:hypothetical protein